MKLLLDESAPRRLASFFPERFEIRTVQQMGWSGSKNGDLLHLAAASGFGALVTVDRGFEYEQNPQSLPVPVVIAIAARSRLQELRPLVPDIVAVLSGELQRRVYRVSA